MKIEVPTKAVKRLFAAEGYLELGMPQQALRELDEIDHLEPIEASVQYLTGEALKAQERYEDALEPLQRAAQLIPAPYNKLDWMSLSECFRRNGKDELADVIELFRDDSAGDWTEQTPNVDHAGPDVTDPFDTDRWEDRRV